MGRVTQYSRAFTGDADNADVGPEWDNGYSTTGSLKIASGTVQPTLISTGCLEVLNVLLPPAQWASFDIAAIVNSTNIASAQIVLRQQPFPNWDNYQLVLVNSGSGIGFTSEILISTGGNGTATVLVSENATTWAAGDGLLGMAQEERLTLWRRPNGSLIYSLLLSWLDLTYTTGQVGMYAFTDTALTDIQIKNFAAGSFDSNKVASIRPRRTAPGIAR